MRPRSGVPDTSLAPLGDGRTSAVGRVAPIALANGVAGAGNAIGSTETVLSSPFVIVVSSILANLRGDSMVGRGAAVILSWSSTSSGAGASSESEDVTESSCFKDGAWSFSGEASGDCRPGSWASFSGVVAAVMIISTLADSDADRPLT